MSKEIKKPQRKDPTTKDTCSVECSIAYNQALSACEAWYKATELSVEEIEKILRDTIDCEYHHREQIKETALAIHKAQELKRGGE